MYLDKSILGCRYGSSRPQRDIAPSTRTCTGRGRLLLDELVTETYPVEDFAKAADDAHHGRVARGCWCSEPSRPAEGSLIPSNETFSG